MQPQRQHQESLQIRSGFPLPCRCLPLVLSSSRAAFPESFRAAGPSQRGGRVLPQPRRMSLEARRRILHDLRAKYTKRPSVSELQG